MVFICVERTNEMGEKEGGKEKSFIALNDTDSIASIFAKYIALH